VAGSPVGLAPGSYGCRQGTAAKGDACPSPSPRNAAWSRNLLAPDGLLADLPNDLDHRRHESMLKPSVESSSWRG
jgi:hypothetical protein